MGFLRDFVIKDERHKKWIGWAVSVFEIAIFAGMALLVKTEWQNGYDTCARQACLVCWAANTTYAPQGANQSFNNQSFNFTAPKPQTTATP